MNTWLYPNVYKFHEPPNPTLYVSQVKSFGIAEVDTQIGTYAGYIGKSKKQTQTCIEC